MSFCLDKFTVAFYFTGNKKKTKTIAFLISILKTARYSIYHNKNVSKTTHVRLLVLFFFLPQRLIFTYLSYSGAINTHTYSIVKYFFFASENQIKKKQVRRSKLTNFNIGK